MKRFRILDQDFDMRVTSLTQEIKETWEDEVKRLHRDNQWKVITGLVFEYGFFEAEMKRANFIDLGPKPFSVLAFHNKFFEQIRRAFVLGAYYPALTAACALGERILNHLVLLLREDFSTTPEYQRVRSEPSFSNWKLVIRVLEGWGVLLPKPADAFRSLHKARNRALHFNPETDQNDRSLALEAILLLSVIIQEQFSTFGPQPWFITSVPGETYLKEGSRAGSIRQENLHS